MIVNKIYEFIGSSSLREEDDRISSEIEFELHDGVVATFKFTARVLYNDCTSRGDWYQPAEYEMGVDVAIDEVEAYDEDDEEVEVIYDKDYIEDTYKF